MSPVGVLPNPGPQRSLVGIRPIPFLRSHQSVSHPRQYLSSGVTSGYPTLQRSSEVTSRYPPQYRSSEVTSWYAPTTVLRGPKYLQRDDEFVRHNVVAQKYSAVLVGGVYHAGVEIYGYEWSYGFTDQPNSGVFPSPPRCVGQHTYRATVVLGQSMLSAREVNDALAYLKQRWQGMDYHLLHKNCLDFANALCIELGVGRMPGWIDRYARTGASLDNFRNAASERIDQTKDLVRAISLDVDNTLKGFGEEAVPKFAEAVQVKAEAMSQGLSRWGTDLFGAMTRAIGNEKQPNRQQKGCSLRDALRNRGGVRLEQASPPCAADPVKE
ncbi:unnamed protein product, partial [Polarella glacialis]